MAITVVCSGCQSKYTLSDSLAGKRAKCKKCGSSFTVPAPEEELPELEPIPDLQPIDAGEGLTPLSDFGDSNELLGSSTTAAKSKGSDLFGDASRSTSGGGLFDDSPAMSADSLFGATDSAAAPSGNPYGTRSSMAPSPSPLGLARPAGGASTGASVVTAIFSTLITFCVAVFTAMLLLCSANPTFSFLLIATGAIACIACIALGILRRPGTAWAVCGIYALICVLGMTKAGFDIVSRGKEVLEEAKRRQEMEMQGQGQPWEMPPPDPVNNGMPIHNPIATHGGNPTPPRPINQTPGWTPPPENTTALEPLFDDWNVTPDPLPDWAKVGTGPPLSLTLYEPAYSNPIRLSRHASRAIGVSHRVGSQDTLEIWDLGERKKVGQLVGRNAFDSNYTISPDGKYMAGKLQFGGEELEIWSVEKQQKLSSVNVAKEQFGSLYYEFSSPTTLLTVTGNRESTKVQIWDVKTGKELQTGSAMNGFGNSEQMAFSPGRKFLVQVNDRALTFWNLTDAQTAGRIRLPSSASYHGCAFSPDGNELLIAFEANSKSYVACCDIATHVVKQHIEFPKGQESPFKLSWGKVARCSWLEGDEGWLVGQEVILRRDGSCKWKIPETMSADGSGVLLDSQQFLSQLKQNQSLTIELKTFPFEMMDKAVAAVAAGGTELDAQLPPIGEPVWDKVQDLTLVPAEGWNLGPDVRSGLKAGAGNKNISLGSDRVQGAIFSDPQHAQVVVLNVDSQSPENQELAPSVRSRLTRYDLNTGKTIVQTKVPGGSDLSAISPTGQKAIVTIGADDARLDLYSLGEVAEQVTAWRPYGDEPAGTSPTLGPDGAELPPAVARQMARHNATYNFGKQLSRQTVTWTAFVDEDHLLTMNYLDGLLVLWKLPEREAIYRVKTGSLGAAALSPGRKYVAFQAGDQIHFLEAKTGLPVGNLKLPFSPANPVEHEASLAFAPDGTRFACIVGDVAGPFMVAFDLRNGKTLAEVPAGTGGTRAQWMGTRQLLTFGGPRSNYATNYLDLDKRAVVWRYNVSNGYKLPYSPDDRIWTIAQGNAESERVLVALPFQPTVDTKNAQAALPTNPAPLFGPGSTVSIDFSSVNGSFGNNDLAQRVKTQLTNYLKARGVQVVDNSPLKITGSVNSGKSETKTYQVTTFGAPSYGRSSPNGSEFSVTSTSQEMKAQLVDGAGRMLWHTSSVSYYSGPGYMPVREGENPQSLVQQQEQSTHKSSVETFFTNLKVPYMVYPQVTDDKGQEKIGADTIQLAGYSRQAEAAGGGAKAAISSASQMASAAMYAKLLDADQATWIQQWKWCAELNRPIVGLRWGIGVQVDQPSNRAKDELRPQLADAGSLRDLDRAAGPIGPSLVQMLRGKSTEGKFGAFVDSTDKDLREVMILGFGERAQLAAAAKKAAVDMVLIIKIDVLTSGRQKDASLQLQILDLGSTKRLWESESLLSSKVAEQKIKGRDLTENLVKGATDYIDEKLTLQPIDAITGPIALSRVEGGTLHRANQLASISELMLYESRDLITREVATAAYTKLLGNSGDAAKLTGDDLASRQSTIKKYVTAFQNSNN